jgi:hypothetical protein
MTDAEFSDAYGRHKDRKQLPTYLRLADKRLGLLINFQVALIKDGIARIVSGLEEDSHAKSPSRQDG